MEASLVTHKDSLISIKIIIDYAPLSQFMSILARSEFIEILR